MALKLKWSDGERAIRSVGDAPNGILSVGMPDDRTFSFYVDAQITAGETNPEVGVRVSGDRSKLEGTMLTVPEVFEAIGDDLQLAGHVYMLTIVAFRTSCDLGIQTDKLEVIRAMLELMIATRDALAELLERGEPDAAAD